MEPLPNTTTPRLSDFDLEIPARLIAQYPAKQRDHCRLMVLERASGAITTRRFHELPELLGAGDVLVLNNTRVIPARLYATKDRSAGRIEVLLLQELAGDRWEVLVKPGRKACPGDRLDFGGGVCGEVVEHTPAGGRVVHFEHPGHSLESFLDEYGRPPLPPYIHREAVPADRDDYQTIYARQRGAVAAPTAGLHFTEDLLARLQAKGVKLAYLTLHVGLGTFRPVKEENVTGHRMEAEFYQVSESTAELIIQAKGAGKRVVAVGTSTARTLETVATNSGQIAGGEGWTELFIYPPYQFKAVDALVTNFHQPRSTLIMMVAAFAGREYILRAYRQAVEEEYRFYSYGDAMLIL